MAQLTTHILDTSKGKPAEEVTVVLFQQQGDNWKQFALGSTNSDGRVDELLKDDVVLEPGIYRLRFDTKTYFEKQGAGTLYPFVEITFSITGPEHYHIPLLLNPFGYTTYRGS